MDMDKAYDRLKWDFIKHTLITTGFPEGIINNIMNCITIVSFSILTNGHPSPSPLLLF